MPKTVLDMWLIALQLFAVGAGLILIGGLSVKIAKNRRQPNRSAPRRDASFNETLVTQLVEQQFQKVVAQVPVSTKQYNSPPADSLRAVVDRPFPHSPRVKRGVKKGDLPRSKGNTKPREFRYQQAAHLAAQGVEPGIIQRRVELPRCEIDLITKLNGQTTPFLWETQQTVLEAIESYG